jgi:hypothetical protein
MKRSQKYLFFAFTSICLSLGYSSLFATETSLQNPQLRKETLTQSETNQNVNEYLEKNKPESYKFLKQRLDAAIEDAKNPQPNEVVNNLWALRSNNPKIKTRERNGKTEFLMVSWKYIKNPNQDWQSGTKKIDYQTWLTVFPEVKEFCNQCKGIGINIPGIIMLSLRLQQYLGLILNRNSNKTHFVEMWVKAEDLSRPCINPEINNSSCNVFPVPVPKTNSILYDIYKNSYTNDKKEYYPWTGLGYTYDWGNPKKPHVGASEFLINPTPAKPVEVEVVSVTPTLEYCNNQNLK